MYPSYLDVYQSGKLEALANEARKMLESCSICPRKCKVNRLRGEKGFCQTGLKAKVYSFMPHHGEEPPISGEHGSGTIFFSHCNMGCVYCQNYEFSQSGQGREVEAEELAGFMLELQGLSCHNINFVTPTHVLPQILEALDIAVSKGLKIPLVYNTSGYDLPQVIRLLEGVVDIYLPDMRYADAQMAIKYSCAPDYPEYNRASIKEMQRQVGVAQIDAAGIIVKGMIIRHLVLPQGISGTKQTMDFIAHEVSPNTYISLMSQYFPCHKAGNFPNISRRISLQEYETAKKEMLDAGLSNGWIQESGGLKRFAGTNIKARLKEEG